MAQPIDYSLIFRYHLRENERGQENENLQLLRNQGTEVGLGCSWPNCGHIQGSRKAGIVFEAAPGGAQKARGDCQDTEH